MKEKSDGSTREMSVLTEVKDLEAVIEYVQNRSYGKPKETVLLGCSQGGLVSARTASKFHSRVAGKADFTLPYVLHS